MQSVLSRNWTRIAVSISCDDNHYTTGTSIRVDVGGVWEVSWRRVQTATYWPKVLLNIAALLPHLGWGCSTVGHWGPQALSMQADSHSGILSPNWLQVQLELTQAVCGTWLYDCLTSNCFHCSSSYLQRCISWLTARSRVNI